MLKLNGMRPQDVPILLQMHLMGTGNWLYADIAAALQISPAEVSESLERSRQAGLTDPEKRKVMTLSLADFLFYGIRYVWPAVAGGKTRGVATAHSAPPLSQLIAASEEGFVWPHKDGNFRGESITPLYKTIPEVVWKNPPLYELLALIDVLRIGRAREVLLAREELKKRLLS